MNEDENKKEITVKAPTRPITSPQQKAEKDKERSLEEERFGVFQISKKVGLYFGAFSMLFGVMLLTFMFYSFISGSRIWTFFSSEPVNLSYVIWFVTSITTVVIGFLLMGSD